MAAEYWDLWDRDPEQWQAWLNVITEGVLPVLQREWQDSPGVELLPNRWDVPGLDVVIPPSAKGMPNDGAWRTVQVYVEARPTVATLQFAAAAWFDEQGPAPLEPWTRWWCHTTHEDEDAWAVRTTLRPDLSDDVQERMDAVVETVRSWGWDADVHRWKGLRISIEEPVMYSSVEPGRRIE